MEKLWIIIESSIKPQAISVSDYSNLESILSLGEFIYEIFDF